MSNLIAHVLLNDEQREVIRELRKNAMTSFSQIIELSDLAEIITAESEEEIYEIINKYKNK